MDKGRSGRLHKGTVMTLNHWHHKYNEVPLFKLHFSSVQGVCQILCEFWSGIPVRWRHKWMCALLQDLSTDGSSVQVRRSVYQSLSQLLKNPKAAEYLGTVLPALYQQIHDTKACVRQSFMQLLLHIKHMGVLQYKKVVPVHHLIARLKVICTNQKANYQNSFIQCTSQVWLACSEVWLIISNNCLSH